MNTNELVKSKAHSIVTLAEYVPHTVISKSIIKKLTGTICVMSFDAGEGLKEKISPFDTFAQIIEGMAELVIEGTSVFLNAGEVIIIPAHKTSFIRPNGRFKMILTVIKSGYE